MLRVDIQQVDMMKQPHSHSASISSPQPKLGCESECNITGNSDAKATDCIVVPISVKPEPDLDPYFLSLLPSRESEINQDDQKMKFDLLNLKLEIKPEIKSELSTDEHISSDVAEMVVDPFKDCLVKPENELGNKHDVPEHSEESLGAFSEKSLLCPTPQAKEDHNNSEALALNEPEGLNQEGRVCHLLRNRNQVQKKQQQQQSENKPCKGKANQTCEAKTKSKSSTPHVCSLCGNIFANSGSLKVHMRIHTGEKPYVCPTCGKAFRHSHRLKEHTRIHTGEKRPAKMQTFLCSKCDKTFARADGLRSHMRRHTQDRPFACSMCGKRFVDSGDMYKHMKLHSNIKPFVCTVCGNSFHRRGTLKKHQRVHTGEQPHNCPECGIPFWSKYSLTTHMKTHR